MPKTFDTVLGARQSVARLNDVLGETALVKHAPSSVGDFLKNVGNTQEIKDGYGTIGGAAAGGLLWSEHRVLGVIGGASLGRNVPALLRPEDRKAALGNMTQTGAAVLGSLYVPGMPVIGFLLGWLVGGAVKHFAKWQ